MKNKSALNNLNNISQEDEEMQQNVLDNIVGFQEASRIWGLQIKRVIDLCKTGEIPSKKILSYHPWGWAIENNHYEVERKENENALDNVIGVQEASILWGLEINHLIHLCQRGMIIAKKIFPDGRGWAIDKNQPIPTVERTSKKELFRVTVGNKPGTVYPIKQREVDDEKEAGKLAKEWSEEYKDKYIYIHYYRMTDGVKGYLNPNGFDFKGQDWGSEYNRKSYFLK